MPRKKSQITNHKFQTKRRFKFRKISTRVLILLITVLFPLVWLFWGIPLPSNLAKNQPVSTKLFDRNGKLIYEIYTNEKRSPIKLEEIPDFVKNATVAIEDKDFYKHHGFSLSGMLRAAYKTIFKKSLQGGSTLTQQLVKNSLLTPERTIRRKIREFALSMIVDATYKKSQILEMYLNQIPYGGAAYGIEAASELYFGKKTKELTLAEATLLAGLPAAPTHYSPFGTHPELAKSRQEIVLRRMVEDGYLSPQEAEEAKNEELKYAEPELLKAPHFALWVKELLAEKYGEAVVEQGGLRVITTLDLDLQEFAQKTVFAEIENLKEAGVGNGAAIVTRPKTGEILAMVGSKDYYAEDEDGKVNIIFAKRQPGSSIKPLNYALALRDEKITPSTPLTDIPTCFTITGQPLYCPKNYDGQFHGLVQARFALGNSYNVPAVKVLTLNGIENFVDFASQMGITTFTDPKNYGLSLTLGGGEVRPFDMATAFGVFANQGIKQNLFSILKITDWKGKVLHEIDTQNLEGDRVLPTSVTYLISHILLDNNARSNAFGSFSQLNISGHPEVSVKTGTTNDLRDNWTIGYTSQALAIVWVGNNDNTPMGRAVSGVSGASPIWNDIMQEVLDKAEEGYYEQGEKGHAWPIQPNEVVGSMVCSTSGGSAVGQEGNPNCPGRFEYFIKDTVPQLPNITNTDIPLDKKTQEIARPDTPPEQIEIQNRSVVYDAMGTLYCLSCPIPSEPITIRYPLE